MKKRIRKPTVEKKKRYEWFIPIIALILILASGGVTAFECKVISGDTTVADDTCTITAKKEGWVVKVFIYRNSIQCDPGLSGEEEIGLNKFILYCEDTCKAVRVGGVPIYICARKLDTGPSPTCQETLNAVNANVGGQKENSACNGVTHLTDDGCWFKVTDGECYDCKTGGNTVTKCEDYGLGLGNNCEANPCKINVDGGGCVVDGSACVPRGGSTKTCDEACKDKDPLGISCSRENCWDVGGEGGLIAEGCWFDKTGACWNCKHSSHGVDDCGGYDNYIDCDNDPCGVGGSDPCGWDGSCDHIGAGSDKDCNTVYQNDPHSPDELCQILAKRIKGGCYLDKSDMWDTKCLNCKDKPDITCENYDKIDCIFNPCKIPGGCTPDTDDECIAAGSSTQSCQEHCNKDAWMGQWPCDEDRCRAASLAVGGRGCWYEKTAMGHKDHCWHCDGTGNEEKAIGECSNYGLHAYPELSCPADMCEVSPTGCKWNGEECFAVGEDPKGVGGLKIVECTCTCKGEEITAYGATSTGCVEACGGMCGGYADYEEDLEEDCTNCKTYCSTPGEGGVLESLLHEGDCKRGCIVACESVCSLNETLYGLVDIIYYVAGIIAAIMFIIQGYKFIVSTTPEERDEAKKAIIYIILAMILIGIAGSLVKTFLGTVSPGGEEPPAKPSFCGYGACGHANTNLPCKCGPAAGLIVEATEDRPWCCAADSAVFENQELCRNSPSCAIVPPGPQTIHCSTYEECMNAINNAKSGDTVVVDVDITHTGTGHDWKADGVTLDCNGHRWYHGLDLKGADGNTIKNCVFKDCSAGEAIYLENSDNNQIIDNTITKNPSWIQHGIMLNHGSKGNTIRNNVITEVHADGISIRDQSDNNKIINNKVTKGTSRGITISGSDNNEITGNTVCEHGIYDVGEVLTCTGNTWSGNTCDKTEGAASCDTAC